MYLRAYEGLGQTQRTFDIDRAVKRNRHWAQKLGWQAYYDRINPVLGFPNYSPDEKTFAEAVAEWQRTQGLPVDGIIGPNTWSRMQTEAKFVLPPTQPWEPMPQPEPKEYRLAAPRSVAEAIELLEYARDLARRDQPNLVGALTALTVVHQFLYPLQGDIPRWFKVRQQGGFFSRIRDLRELQAAEILVPLALENLHSLYGIVKHGSTGGGLWDLTINRLKIARYFLEVLAGEGLSFELKDAPPYRPSLETTASKKLGLSKSQVRVFAWFRKYKHMFEAAERVFRIDRRAVAGAIAWEALENPWFIPGRSIGPGKMHYKTGAFGGEDTVAKQVEDAGYLKKRSQADRKILLSSPSGAIMYIAASMKAAADIALQEHGSNIYRDLGVLTWFYLSKDLNEWRQHLKRKRAKGERTFDVQEEPMPRWVLRHLDFLELAVGKPNIVPKYP